MFVIIDFLHPDYQSVVVEGLQQSIQKAETSIALLANPVLNEGKYTDTRIVNKSKDGRVKRYTNKSSRDNRQGASYIVSNRVSIKGV